MSKLAKPGLHSLPGWMVLVLVFCLLSLGVHFFTESIGSDGLFSPASEAAGHYDELFIPIQLSLLSVSFLFMKILSEEASFQQSFGSLPLLPPPNH